MVHPRRVLGRRSPGPLAARRSRLARWSGSRRRVLSAVIGFGGGLDGRPHRTSPGAGCGPESMFALLLARRTSIALGWERLLEPAGVLDMLGVPDAAPAALLYGPVGVVVVLTVKGVPFAYLAISGALRGLGEEFEVAVRVHGGGRVAATRIVGGPAGPGVWSAFAIVFAESVSDFGVAATLANDAHFPVATFTLYNAIDSFPVQFPRGGRGRVDAAWRWPASRCSPRRGRCGAAAIACSAGEPGPPAGTACRRPPRSSALAGLVVLVRRRPRGAGLRRGVGVADQRPRVAGRRARADPGQLPPGAEQPDAAATRCCYSAKLAADHGDGHRGARRSVAARLLSTRGGRVAGRVLDLLLLTAVALPGIVFAAGYIFTYNLPLMNRLGIHLYGTTTLLVLGYLATALPSTSRVLLGLVSQVQESLREAARVHGSGMATSWLRTVLPAARAAAPRGMGAGLRRRPCSSCRSRNCSTRPASPGLRRHHQGPRELRLRRRDRDGGHRRSWSPWPSSALAWVAVPRCSHRAGWRRHGSEARR